MAEKVKSKYGQVDAVDGYDLGEYRYAVAKVARFLIRARLICDPEFKCDIDRSAWSIPPYEPHPSLSDSEIAEGFLRQAKAANRHLWGTFIGPNGSGGVSPHDPLKELKAMVNCFYDDVDEAIAQLQNRKKVEWKRVAKWRYLSSIRDWLDRLPIPKDRAACPVVIVDSATYRFEVNGKEKTLNRTGFEVIKCLLNAYPGRLTKDALATTSHHTDAVGVLKRLRRTDIDWKAVIHLAGVTGGRYGIVVPETD